MTFAEQVRWSRVWGLRLMVFGAAGVAMVLGGFALVTGSVATPVPLAEVPMVASFAGLVLYAVGGWVRPAHRRVVLTLVVPDPFWRKAALGLSVLRLWAWVDQNGRDRDA